MTESCRRINCFVTITSFGFLAIILVCSAALSQEKDFNAYPDNVAKYLKRIYDKDQQPLAYGDDYRGGFSQWQQGAREALRNKLGLEKIAISVGDHQPIVKALFEAAGHANRFEHRWGDSGHRFYADLMWPFVPKALKQKR